MLRYDGLHGEQSKLWSEIKRHETCPTAVEDTPTTRTSPWLPQSSGQDSTSAAILGKVQANFGMHQTLNLRAWVVGMPACDGAAAGLCQTAQKPSLGRLVPFSGRVPESGVVSL